MYDLTGFQRALLYIVAGNHKPHGLAIKEVLENTTLGTDMNVSNTSPAGANDTVHVGSGPVYTLAADDRSIE